VTEDILSHFCIIIFYDRTVVTYHLLSLLWTYKYVFHSEQRNGPLFNNRVHLVGKSIMGHVLLPEGLL